MATDIFDFWHGIRVKVGPHPADRRVLKRVDHGFDMKRLPLQFFGPLKTAPVVLLYLSPGLNPDRNYREARTREGREWHRRTWQGEEPLPNSNWCRSRTARFGRFDEVRSRVAVLNIGCYHSKHFKGHYLLSALPSCRMSVGWAQEVLFPQAYAGKRVVICMRAAPYWGLRHGEPRYGKALFAPKVTRGGHMEKNGDNEEIILKARALFDR